MLDIEIDTLANGVRMPGLPDPKNVYKLDGMVQPLLDRMHRVGIGIDLDRLNDIGNRMSTDILRLNAEVQDAVRLMKNLDIDPTIALNPSDEDININSPGGMAEILFDVLGFESTEMTATGGRKTGKKVLEGLKATSTQKDVLQILNNISRLKELKKLKSTYVDGLTKRARKHNAGYCRLCNRTHKSTHYRIHSRFLDNVTITGRLASRDPNLQNIPARTEDGRLIRSCFTPQEGYCFVQRDLSGIELRILAHMSKDPDFVHAFTHGLDPHAMVAARLFNKPIDQVDKLLERAPAKNINFGTVYGLTPIGFYANMLLTYATSGKPVPAWLTQSWCELFIARYFKEREGVKRLIDTIYEKVRAHKLMWNLFGRVLWCPEIDSPNKSVQSEVLRQACNFPFQSGNAELMRLAMYEISLATVGDVEMVASVHDELVIEVPEHQAEEVDVMAKMIFNGVTTTRKGKNLFIVPIESDGKIMSRWEK